MLAPYSRWYGPGGWSAQRAEGPESPVPIMALDMGTVTHIDLDGSRVIADCRQLRESHITGGPRSGQIDRTWEPCLLFPREVRAARPLEGSPRYLPGAPITWVGLTPPLR